MGIFVKLTTSQPANVLSSLNANFASCRPTFRVDHGEAGFSHQTDLAQDEGQISAIM